ncbi:MAG: hypothetical protein NT038_10620 [Euryarchaeota archaeon]|nr:hypothetical protein [Euryarchaeota archaeon]
MFNFEEILQGLVNFAYAQPIIITALFTGLIGFFYYLGWIINANYWQYQNSTKETHIYRGFIFLSVSVFFPGILILFLIYLVDKNGEITSFFQNISIILYLIILLIIVLLMNYLDTKMFYKIRKFIESNWIMESFLLGLLRALFFLMNYGIVVSVENYSSKYFILLITVWLDIWILSQWARISTLPGQAAEAEIELRNGNEKIKVRLIEFVEKGLFLKVQEIKKDEEKVFAIPTSQIEKMELLTKKPPIEKIIPMIPEKIKNDDVKTKQQNNQKT